MGITRSGGRDGEHYLDGAGRRPLAGGAHTAAQPPLPRPHLVDGGTHGPAGCPRPGGLRGRLGALVRLTQAGPRGPAVAQRRPVPVVRPALTARPGSAPVAIVTGVIFKRVGEGRPYPDHGMSSRAWAAVPPRQVRLDELVTTKDTLQLAALLDEDSTFYGDLFAHVVEWQGEYYLEDGLHRALRAALQQRNVLHARVHTVED